MPPLAEPSLEHVHAEEPHPGTNQEPRRGSADSALLEIRRRPLRVPGELLEVAVEVGVRFVRESLLELPDAPFDSDLRMDVERLVRPLRPIEEPQHLVALPSRRPDRPPQEPVRAPDPVTVRAGGIGEDPLDLLPERGRDPLVGVDNQHPAVRELRDRPVLLRGRIHVLVLEHPIGDRSRDRHGPVGASRIDDHDLLGPPHRFQAGADVRLLVPGRNKNAQRLAHGASRAAPRSSVRAAEITRSAGRSRIHRMWRSPGSGQVFALQ